MWKLLKSTLLIAIAGLVLAPRPAAPRSNAERKALHARQRQENKIARQQQRAMTAVMKQHAQTPESRQRFKSNMKLQRQLTKQNHRQESRRLHDQGK